MFSVLPTFTGQQRTVFIHSPLEIKINKDHPPYALFEEIRNSLQQEKAQVFASDSFVFLQSGDEIVNNIKQQELAAQNQIAYEQPEPVSLESIGQSLNRQQKVRLELAQQKNRVLDSDWSYPTLNDLLKNALAEIPNEFKRPEALEKNVSTTVAVGPKTIVGNIEVLNGLAVTDTTSLEVRRFAEGMSLEVGRVDLREGTYEIAVEDLTGVLKAKLLDQKGSVLGEDTIRLSSLPKVGQLVAGPALKLKPNEGSIARIRSNQKSRAKNKREIASNSHKNSVWQVSSLNGAIEYAAKSENEYEAPGFQKNSNILKEVVDADKVKTYHLSRADESVEIEHLALSERETLFDFVNAQVKERNILKRDGNIIYGKVVTEGFVENELSVELESFKSLKPIYFNEMFMPVASLSHLTGSGYFMFLDVPEGFHSLRLNRSGSFMSFVNTIVKNDGISFVQIQTSASSDAIPVRIYDAFSGVPLVGKLLVQGAAQEIFCHDGSGVASLKPINRMGLIQSVIADAQYVSAHYQYADSDEFLHVPAVQSSWLEGIQSQLRLSDSAFNSTLVGFVPEKTYEVYLADSDNGAEHIVYFDSQGNIIPDKRGIPGGGFIIFNMKPGVSEVVIVEDGKQDLWSTVVPADPDSVSILTVR
ncbi:MAG: hypothetical protein ACLGGX_01940 [Bdellovibrionia bacterium]